MNARLADGRLLYWTRATGWVRFFDGEGWRTAFARNPMSDADAELLTSFCRLPVEGTA